MYDPMELIAAYAQHPVIVMSDSLLKNLKLLDLDSVNTEVRANLEARGLHLVAVAGILNGAPALEMPRPLPPNVAFAIGVAHRDYITRRSRKAAEPEYDWVSRRYN